ncbi:MAG: gfo/Idh/MocA family oxidoreductase, partial [Actinomycetota bacterium]|nr:gfo/Idh/MocA family oxidoreductase [Actinomycetota bacterium]
AAWNFETMNELQLYLPAETPADCIIRVLAGDAFPHHGNFVPGGGNPIGYEDLKVIEDLEFLTAVVARREAPVTFADALAAAEVEAAMARSWDSGTWEDVTSLRIN